MSGGKKGGIVKQARNLARQINERPRLSARNLRRLVGRLRPETQATNAELIEAALRKARGESR